MPAALVPLGLMSVAGAQELPAVPLTQVEADQLDPLVHRSHAIAMHGEPKYGPDFTHFDYVNPDAPKGGTLRRAESGTFDTFNEFIPKGAPGHSSTIESLMEGSGDEP
ncbi:MAG: ABC transporter substrate-binding protein, partial [Alphaproteobacteria bacterium]